MDDFLKMDVFFVVATLGVVMVSVLASLILWHALRIMRVLDRLSHDVAEEAHALQADLNEIRKKTKRDGRELGKLVELALATGRRLLRIKR